MAIAAILTAAESSATLSSTTCTPHVSVSSSSRSSSINSTAKEVSSHSLPSRFKKHTIYLADMSINMSTTPKEQDVEVRFADQEQISEFGRLNNRLMELRAELKQIVADVEKLEDATAELSMTIGGTVMILIGESFVHSDEDSANAYCERKTAVLQERAEELRAEEKTITGRQDVLKKELYARFGDSINLEN